MTISLVQEKQYGSRLHWAIFHSHVGFCDPRHGWITHVMAYHTVTHYTHIHLRWGRILRAMFHCGR
jgi:hypothetical protein